jgi:hypothetical protein
MFRREKEKEEKKKKEGPDQGVVSVVGEAESDH